MADRYVVRGAAVVLPIEGGTERYLYRGAQVGDGFTVAGIKHALALGLIEKDKTPTESDEAAAEQAEADKAAAATK